MVKLPFEGPSGTVNGKPDEHGLGETSVSDDKGQG